MSIYCHLRMYKSRTKVQGNNIACGHLQCKYYSICFRYIRDRLNKDLNTLDIITLKNH